MSDQLRAPLDRKRLPHDTPSWVRDGSTFFITICCTPRGHNQLCHPGIAHVLFESVRFRHARGDWYVHLLLLMPDHLHGLISFPRDRAMKSVVSKWKEIVAKKTTVVWQRDFFDHRLRDDENFMQKAHYIRMNPVRAHLTTDRVLWPFKWEADPKV